MRIALQIIFLSAFACLSSNAIAFAQSPTPAQSPVPIEVRVNRQMPSLTANPAKAETSLVMQTAAVSAPSGEQQQTSPNLYPPPKDWPKPVEHNPRYLFLLADQLEFSPKGNDSSFRWDIEGWYGGDFNRLWIKTEGDQLTSKDKSGEGEVQFLYSRFVARYWDFQAGLRYDKLWGKGSHPSRLLGVVGFEGLAPYWFEIEPALFISDRGDVSARLTTTYDLLVTQRLILQPRFETNVAVQRVERFRVGKGVNDIELGLRLRYEIRREFAPYIGFSWTRTLGDTADLARREGEKVNNIGVVLGVRLWF